jgi:plastocyanin
MKGTRSQVDCGPVARPTTERRMALVKPRRLLSITLLAVLGGGVAVFPALAGSETTPAIEAVNSSGYYGEQHHHWSPPQVTVNAGGVVSISNPSEVNHGVEWVGGPEKPACSGIPVGTSPASSGAKWSGTCTLSKPGTYTFYCTVHGPEMTGTITVNANGTTTTTMSTAQSPPPGAAAPTSPGEASPTTSSGSPSAVGAAAVVKLAAGQHGSSVHGAVEVSQAGAGGRLEVDLLARGASLAKVGRASRVRVGRFVRSSLTAGVVPFAVPLTAKARSALLRHRRLELTVQVLLTPAHGSAVVISRSVVLHA